MKQRDVAVTMLTYEESNSKDYKHRNLTDENLDQILSAGHDSTEECYTGDATICGWIIDSEATAHM